MKTYKFLALSIVLFFGCTKNDQLNDDEKKSELTESHYTIVLNKNSVSSTKLLKVTEETMLMSNKQSNFGSITKPDFIYKDKKIQTSISTSNCLGSVVQYDFANDTKISFTVFSEIENCKITIKAIAHSEKNVFIAYEEYDENLLKTFYKLKIVNAKNPDTINDIELDIAIVDIVFAANNVYVLLENEDEKNSLLALDQDSGETLLNMNLDFDAVNILKNSNDNILIAYDNMHLLIDSTTNTSISETRYDDGTSPKFSSSQISNFDSNGKLYYAIPIEFNGNISDVPSVFDFDKNLTTLYYYENFLSEEKRDQTYKIGETTIVIYDNDNKLILIGYKRYDNPDKGGIIRIKPVPNPEFVDQIDVDGVPSSIFIK